MSNLQKIVRTWVPWAVVILLIAGSLAAGKFPLDWSNLGDPAGLDRRVFVNLRLGRTLTAVLAGTVVGMGGWVLQTVFRNPLAAPDVIGVASGASAGAGLSILVFSGTTALTSLFAFGGGMLAIGLVILMNRLAGKRGISSLVICGICVNAIFQAALTLLKVSADRENLIASMEFWTMGSFADVTMKQFRTVLPWSLAGLAGIMLLSRRIRMLAFSDDEAATLGVPVKRTRVLALVATTLAVSAVISTVGLISFAGLLAPHIARQLSPGKQSGPGRSGLCGVALLLAADILTRCVTVRELPISVWTSLLGVPMLLILLLRRERVE